MSKFINLLKKQNTDSPKTKLIKDLLTLSLALLVVIISFVILNPIAQNTLQKDQERRAAKQQVMLEGQNLPSLNFYKGIVKSETTKESQQSQLGIDMIQQNVEVELVEGPKKGQVVNIEVFTYSTLEPLKVGSAIIVRELNFGDNQKEPVYSFVDFYRIDLVMYLIFIFILLVILLSGFKGLNSFLGLAFSIIVLMLFFLPQVVGGSNVYLITFVSSLMIVLVSTYLSHGFNKKSTISIVSIMITILVVTLFSIWAVGLTRLSGISGDESFYLISNKLNNYLNIRSILLAGIIIGTIGVLDDVATTQAATVEEIYKANPKLGGLELFWRAMNVGKEHVVSMVNTLALVYAGGALPLMLLLTIGTGNPLWVILNNEMIIEEVVRTVGGSVGLLLAVPITTLLAAKFIPSKNPDNDLDSKDEPSQTKFKNEILEKMEKISQKTEPQKSRISLG